MMQLRPYQEQLAQQATSIICAKKIVYCAMEMRVGKTLIALKTADNIIGQNIIGRRNVLFVTKKKAISSVESDFNNFRWGFNLTVTNYEQLDKLIPQYDVIIADEAHGFGAFPKPSGRQKELKRIVENNYLILLSGTPSPESVSQLFHQFNLSVHSPFRHKNFYRWADEFVTIRERRLPGRVIKDYSGADRDAVMAVLDDYFIYYTQADAGFEQEVIEEVQHVPMDWRIAELIQQLLKNRYYKFNDGIEEIVCDTPAKLQQKIHQISSGTVITESGKAKTLVTDKIAYIKRHYAGKKIAIFYKFIAEGNALRAAFPTHTDSPERFKNDPDAIFIGQIQSNAMGINLSCAEVLLFYNIDFSSQMYWQARARLSDKNRTTPALVHWLFSQGGIEEKIYKAVLGKKDYTNYYFRQDYLNAGSQNSKQNPSLAGKAGVLRN